MKLVELNEAEFYFELGRKLHARRKHLKIGQQELAEQLGVHRNTLTRWESGEFAIHTLMLLRLTDLLSTNILALLPDREYTWGDEQIAIPAALAAIRKPVQSERDPALTARENGLGVSK